MHRTPARPARVYKAASMETHGMTLFTWVAMFGSLACSASTASKPDAAQAVPHASAAGAGSSDKPVAGAPGSVAPPSLPTGPTGPTAGAVAMIAPPLLPTGTMKPGAPATNPVMPPAAATASAPAPPPPPFVGPIDGDPSKPMVSIPGIACGVPPLSFQGSPPSVKITNRDVVVAYPCAHEGAAVTFFLFLHGTLEEAQKVSFTMNAFAIHNLVDSHNVIVVVPKAIGTQWGNGDNGQDLPHLYDVIDWVYATFGQKFSIRSMWSQGGSWGAAYLANFACDPKLQDRLRGIQLIVGGGCPSCASRLSCIVGQQEQQLGNGMALSADQREMYSDMFNVAPYASQHGCAGKVGPMDVGNVKAWDWPNCQPGWTHSFYMAPGMHADTWDMAAVLRITEQMKATEN
jgi:hypothetical protein